MVVRWCTKRDVPWDRCPLVFQGHPWNFKFTQDKHLPILTRIWYLRTVTLCRSYKIPQICLVYIANRFPTACEVLILFCWFPDEHLVECIGLADEYMIGRLRHACIQCMISNAHKLELNERLLYLRLVYKYQLPEVEEKIVNWFCQRPTADILQCENYDIFSAAPLLLRRAQWLETELVRHQERIDSILSQAMELYTDLDKCVIGMLGRLTKAMNESNTPGQQCSSGHCISSGYSYNSNYSAVYISTCCHCALLSRQQFSNTLSIANGYTSLETTETQIINGERQVKKTESNFSWPCFSSNMKMKFDQLKWQGVIMPPPRCVPPRIDNAIWHS